MKDPSGNIAAKAAIASLCLLAALATAAPGKPHGNPVKPVPPTAVPIPAPIRVVIDPSVIGSIFLSQALPVYPRDELCNGIGGTVSLAIDVDERGHPVDVKIERSSRSHPLDDAAIAAARTWILAPHAKDGVPVANVAHARIRFHAFNRPADCPAARDSQDAGFAAYYHLKPNQAADAGQMAQLRRAADDGVAPAQVMLGQMYAVGNGVSSDLPAARQWFEKAAAHGNAIAEAALGSIYSEGMGVSRDSSQSRAWFEKAAAQDNADAELALGLINAKGDGVPVDNVQAVQWFQKAAAQGNSMAQVNLGIVIARGEGAPRDDVLAAAWMTLASERIPVSAYVDLPLMETRMTNAQVDEVGRLVATWAKGDVLQHDPGIDELPFNSRVAALEKRAGNGDVDAEVALGDMYARVLDIPGFSAKAIKWYEQAANHGSAKAAHILADAFDRGHGIIARDPTQVVEWYRKSIALGNTDDALALGWKYAQGSDVDRDKADAAQWFALAAAYGNPSAQIAIATALARGDGVTRDDVLAYAWFSLAARQQWGGQASGAMGTLKARMTATDVADAEKLASHWQTGYAISGSTIKPTAP